MKEGHRAKRHCESIAGCNEHFSLSAIFILSQYVYRHYQYQALVGTFFGTNWMLTSPITQVYESLDVSVNMPSQCFTTGPAHHHRDQARGSAVAQPQEQRPWLVIEFIDDQQRLSSGSLAFSNVVHEVRFQRGPAPTSG